MYHFYDAGTAKTSQLFLEQILEPVVLNVCLNWLY